MMVGQAMTAAGDNRTLRRPGGGTEWGFILTVPLIVAVLAGILDLGIGLQQWSAFVDGAQSATARGFPAPLAPRPDNPSTIRAPG
jgi:hypothetical protein